LNAIFIHYRNCSTGFSMQKKKTPGSSTPDHGSHNGSTAHALRPFRLFAILACLLMLACAAIINLLHTNATNQRQLAQSSQQLANTYAVALAQFIQDQSTYLQSLARRPAIVAALGDNNTLALRSLESDFSGAYAYATRLNLIPLGSMGTAALDFPEHRLNSIETAMLIEANRGNPVAPEAYKRGRQSVITLLQTAGQADTIIGALLLSLDSSAFTRIMDQLGQGLGQITLQQQIKGEAIDLFQQGEAAADVPVAVSDFPGNPNWQLQFRASEQLISATRASTMVPWILLLGASLLLLGYGLWAYRRMQHKLETEFTELTDYLDRLKAGERALPPALQLDRLTTIGALAFDISQMPANGGKPSSTDAVAAAELGAKMSAKKASKTPAVDAHVEELEHSLEPEPTPEREPVAPGIFRAYDIRGVVGQDLTFDAVYQIGLAIGSEARDQDEDTVIVARDGRLSSEELAGELCRGLQDSGVDVIDLGLAPTPLLYFATQQLNTSSGVMVTGSHNPPQYNGLKVVIKGQTLYEDSIAQLGVRIEQNQLYQGGSGAYSTADLRDQYIDYVLGDIAIAQPLKVVLDCGNGVAGVLAPRLFEELGCEVIPLYCDVDGNFPNHHPDPTIAANLVDLVEQVRAHGADLGIAFDGDGDRLGVVSASGEMISADQLLMLFAQDVVSRNPGCDVVFDVKCTRHLNDVIASYGGRPIMWKSGHSLIKQKMVETGALLGGEFSGHIFFKERWFGFDDGLYSGARLIEIMSTTNPSLDALLEQFPTASSTPELFIEVGEERKFDIVERFATEAEFGNAKLNTIDGVRVDFPEGWGLLRASNTTPRLVMRFEADSSTALDDIMQRFQAELQRIEPGLAI
jgi:phosphomannomutase/phosphoglucomutase